LSNGAKISFQVLEGTTGSAACAVPAKPALRPAASATAPSSAAILRFLIINLPVSVAALPLWTAGMKRR
jgi:hypothetical protein